MDARFACGSMVLFDLFSQTCCEKDGNFRPAGGEVSCRFNDRV